MDEWDDWESDDSDWYSDDPIVIDPVTADPNDVADPVDGGDGDGSDFVEIIDFPIYDEWEDDFGTWDDWNGTPDVGTMTDEAIVRALNQYSPGWAKRGDGKFQNAAGDVYDPATQKITKAPAGGTTSGGTAGGNRPATGGGTSAGGGSSGGGGSSSIGSLVNGFKSILDNFSKVLSAWNRPAGSGTAGTPAGGTAGEMSAGSLILPAVVGTAAVVGTIFVAKKILK